VTRQYELPGETAAEAGDEAVRRVAAAVRRGVGEAVAAAAGEDGAREDAGPGEGMLPERPGAAARPAPSGWAVGEALPLT
jgi:hypothetical protein